MSEEFQKLSEGYDFIEEAVGYSAPLEFSEVEDTSIVESEGKQSKFKVLGRCVGQFQPCGEFSRNKRLYESDHWPHLLESQEFQDRIKARDLMGTLGHMDKKVDDNDIREGLVSHIVTCLEIHEDANGTPFLYGELEILDTPAGRNLKALYEGGANLYVSSRGAGKLLPVPGQDYKLVDKNNYFCETFDIVRRPGFLKAKPMFEEVKESIEEAVNENTAIPPVAPTQEVVDQGKKEENKKDSNQKPDAEAFGDALKKAMNSSESEVEVLKAQVEKLAKIVEKVVDDTYELPVKKNPEELSEALTGFLELMTETNVSDDTMKEILDIIFNKEGK